MKILLLLLVAYSYSAAASFGVGIGFNNPAYTDKGLNLSINEAKWSIEFGFGEPSVTAFNDEAFANIAGDVDVKYYFSDSVSPYVETGLRTHYGFVGGANPTVNFSASAPFFGFGLAYRGKVLLYWSVDYNVTYGDLYTAWGFGIYL